MDIQVSSFSSALEATAMGPGYKTGDPGLLDQSIPPAHLGVLSSSLPRAGISDPKEPENKYFLYNNLHPITNLIKLS